MAIKALFLTGRSDTTTENLYQWDYGQELEIESPDLGSMLCEVHFACHGMSEAIVRPCNLSAGIGNVTIPDDCLEQSSGITAWIYEKGANDARGRTRGVITIPVVARTRPGVVRDIPPETNDQYTLLIAEVNDAIDDIENGVVKAKYAKEADTAKNAEHATTADSATTAGNANYATTAGTASSATNATSAGFATNAGTANEAKKATNDINGKPLADCLRGNRTGFTKYTGDSIAGGFFAFRIVTPTLRHMSIIAEICDNEYTSYSGIFYVSGIDTVSPETYTSAGYPARLKFEHTSISKHKIVAEIYHMGAWNTADFSPTIYYQRLSDSYPIG